MSSSKSNLLITIACSAVFPADVVALNKNGYSAVLQKSNTDSESKSVITLFDNEGKPLASLNTYKWLKYGTIADPVIDIVEPAVIVQRFS